MVYIYTFIGIALVAIFVILNCFKRITTSEAYVIERKGNFYKVVTSGIIFLIPFIDKIKGIVDLSTKTIKGDFHKAILKDNSVITLQCEISYHICDPQKAVYLNEKINLELEFLANTVLRDIVSAMNLDETINLNDKIKHEMKACMRKSSYEFGCEIDDIQVELVDDKDYEHNSFRDNTTNVVKKHELQKHNDVVIFINVVLIILFFFGVYLAIYELYKQNQNLTYYFIKISIPSLLVFFVCIEVSFGLLNISNIVKSQKYKVSEDKLKYKLKKVKKSSVILLAIILLFIYEFLEIPNGVSLGGIHTSLLEYKNAILQDIVSKETTTIKTRYVYTSKSGGRSSSSIPATIRYKRDDSNDNYYQAEINNSLVEIIDDLKKLEDEITIEYYNNSKIIKTIDGIDKFDYDGFYKRAVYLGEEKKKQIEQEKIEQEKIKKDQEKQEKLKREKEAKERELQQAAVGKNIEEVKKELEENEILDYRIEYISSKLYSKGIVAFSDKGKVTNDKIVLYVVKDNNYEDMVKMPKLEFGMSKDKVEQILKDSGLDSNFYIKEINGNFKRGLQTYSYSAGTLLPRGLKVTILIYE